MSILSPALLGAVGLVMVAASLSHLRAPGALRHGLRAHGVLADWLHGPVSRVLGPLELLLGGAALFFAVTGAPRGATLAVGMPLAALSLALTLYLGHVLRVTEGRAVPCACGLGETPVSRSAVLRAGILTVLSVAGASTATGWSIVSAGAAEVLVTVAAMLVLALVTALLPAARAVPDPALRAGSDLLSRGGTGGQNPYENAGTAYETPIFLRGAGR